jgi:hypothetical protein
MDYGRRIVIEAPLQNVVACSARLLYRTNSQPPVVRGLGQLAVATRNHPGDSLFARLCFLWPGSFMGRVERSHALASFICAYAVVLPKSDFTNRQSPTIHRPCTVLVILSM